MAGKRQSWGWNSSDHVSLPCAFESVFGNNQSRWTFIKESFRQNNQMTSSTSVECKIKSYNRKYENVWCFAALHEFNKQNEQLFKETISKITKLAIELPELISQPIPLLQQKKEQTFSLSQRQIASLLANAFLCTFPWRNDTRSPSSAYFDFPSINFNSLFHDDSQMNVEKIKCIFNYFKRVGDNSPEGVVTFTRRVLENIDKPDWRKSDKRLSAMDIMSTGNIETDGEGMLQVDFANKFVGGGVIGSGCIQEEIRFVINTELIVSRLFTQKLLENEALVITGTERFNQYTGYSHSFKWKSDFVDKTPLDQNNRRKCSIVAIDAYDYKHNPSEQYSTRFIERDLNKAYAGFCNKDGESNNLLPVATGNWGCGAFKGDPSLKALIQLMAASEAGRQIKYFTFGDDKLVQDTKEIVILLDAFQTTVGKLFKLICRFERERSNGDNLFKFISKRLSDASSSDNRGSSPVVKSKGNRLPTTLSQNLNLEIIDAETSPTKMPTILTDVTQTVASKISDPAVAGVAIVTDASVNVSSQVTIANKDSTSTNDFDEPIREPSSCSSRASLLFENQGSEINTPKGTKLRLILSLKECIECKYDWQCCCCCCCFCCD